MGDSANVGVCRRCRVGAGALEQDKPRAAGFPCNADRFVQFGHCRHAGRDDHRLAGDRYPVDQRQIGVLEGGDLVARHIERFEKLDRRFVEGGTEANESPLPATVKDRCVPFPGGVGFLVEFVERGPLPEAVRIADVECPFVKVDGHGVGGVGLQFQRMGTCRGGRIDNRQRTVEGLVVVA